LSPRCSTVTGSPGGGTFTLAFRGETSAAIAHNAAKESVEEKLEALPTIGVGNVAVAGSNGGPYTITFGRAVMGDAPLLVADHELSGGTTPGVTVADAWTALAPEQYQGEPPTVGADDDNDVFEFGVVDTKRLIRVVVASTNTSDGGILGAVVAVGDRRRPVR
jgi:hypothetical protein